VTPPALGKGASQNDPIIFSDEDGDKSFGSADLPNTEDMDMADGGDNNQQVQRR
jgi:hypothetical protein